MLEIFLYVSAAISAITLFLYGWDKLCAIRRKWRVRESVLLLLALAGGSVGALAGMLLFRHQTRHWYFWAISFLGLALELAVIYLLYRFFPTALKA